MAFAADRLQICAEETCWNGRRWALAFPSIEWLRGPLKEWAGDLLSPSSLGRSGLLDPAPIAEKWAEHQSGARNWQYFLWNVLMFEAWHENDRTSRLSRSDDFAKRSRGEEEGR